MEPGAVTIDVGSAEEVGDEGFDDLDDEPGRIAEVKVLAAALAVAVEENLSCF